MCVQLYSDVQLYTDAVKHICSIIYSEKLDTCEKLLDGHELCRYYC